MGSGRVSLASPPLPYRRLGFLPAAFALARFAGVAAGRTAAQAAGVVVARAAVDSSSQRVGDRLVRRVQLSTDGGQRANRSNGHQGGDQAILDSRGTRFVLADLLQNIDPHNYFFF